MHKIKMAQLRASPCLTPLSMQIFSLEKPFIRILAVIFLYKVLNTLTNFGPNPYAISTSSM